MRRSNRKQLQRFTVKDFSGGINTDSENPEINELRKGLNYNITQRGALIGRGGSAQNNAAAPIPVTSGKNISGICELWTRNLSTGVKSRHLIGHAKTNIFSIQTTGDTLAITGETNLRTNLKLDAAPDRDSFHNKMFFLNGTDAVWSDGTQCKDIGIEAPTVDPTKVSDAATGGYMSDGLYRFYYVFARSTSYGFHGEVDGYIDVTLAHGGALQKVTIQVTSTDNADTSADKIYLFRTKLGDLTTWYKVAEAANPNDGTTVNIVATIADNSIASINLYVADNIPPPAGVKFIVKAGSRMVYADDNYLYWSKPNLPECVPADNIEKLAEDDGQNVMGLALVLNYILIVKNAKTFILDYTLIGQQEPHLISNSIGCVNFRTLASIEDGQMVAWISHEGPVATNGVEVKSLVNAKIYFDFQLMDFSRADEAFAVYYSTKKQYVCSVPYQGSGHKIWIFSVPTGGWTRHAYSYIPGAYGVFTNEYWQHRLMQTQGSAANGYIVETDLSDGDDDGASVRHLMAIPFTSLNTPEIVKSVRMMHVEWICSNKTEAEARLGLDGQEVVDSYPLYHDGGGEFDNVDHGFDDDEIGCDMGGEDVAWANFRETRGSTFNAEIEDTTPYIITIKSITFSFRVQGQRLY